MTERIGGLTVDELEQIVDRIVDARLKQSGVRMQSIDNDDPEFFQRMRNNLIPLKPGAPSPTQMLQEERDKWRNPTS